MRRRPASGEPPGLFRPHARRGPIAAAAAIRVGQRRGVRQPPAATASGVWPMWRAMMLLRLVLVLPLLVLTRLVSIVPRLVLLQMGLSVRKMSPRQSRRARTPGAQVSGASG